MEEAFVGKFEVLNYHLPWGGWLIKTQDSQPVR